MMDVINGSHQGIEDVKANGQFDITKPKRSAGRVRGSGFGVFTRMVKMKEGNIGHINRVD
jgi:hypothetical protein